jgi:hypothetical protein
MYTCLNCGKTEQEIPLIKIRYQAADIFICPQCLPILIHKPANLAEKLPGLENVQPTQNDHN